MIAPTKRLRAPAPAGKRPPLLALLAAVLPGILCSCSGGNDGRGHRMSPRPPRALTDAKALRVGPESSVSRSPRASREKSPTLSAGEPTEKPAARRRRREGPLAPLTSGEPPAPSESALPEGQGEEAGSPAPVASRDTPAPPASSLPEEQGEEADPPAPAASREPPAPLGEAGDLSGSEPSASHPDAPGSEPAGEVGENGPVETRRELAAEEGVPAEPASAPADDGVPRRAALSAEAPPQGKKAPVPEGDRQRVAEAKKTRGVKQGAPKDRPAPGVLPPGKASQGVTLQRTLETDAGKKGAVRRRATGPLAEDKTKRDYGQDCLRSGCHAKLNEAPQVHGPISVAACDTCHEPDGKEAEHKFRLSRPSEQLCTSCHRLPPVQEVVHKPYGDAACLECHDPHGGATRALLVGESIAKLCEKCHEPAENHKVQHGPFAVGECAFCHSPHQSPQANLLALPSGDLCVKCHSDVGKTIAAAPYAHGPAAVDCAACHFGHGGDNRLLLRKDTRSLCLGCHDAVAESIAKDSYVHGALDSDKSCAGCHTPHASQFKSQLRAVESDLCLTCHDRRIVNRETKRTVANVAAQIRGAKFKHGPIRTGDCQGCHFAHSGTHGKLLRQSYPPEFYKQFSFEDYALCFECHEKTLVMDERTTTLTNFRDGDQNLHFLHVNREKGRTCRACHEIHASNFPKHIRKSVPFGSSGWMLPINFTKTPTGGSCAPGCHKAKEYNSLSPGGGTTPESPGGN